MTLLVDLNQVMLSGLLSQVKPKEKLEEDLIRHIITNTLRANIKKFKEYGEVILCCDARNYWRKDVYPYYKAHRKENREKSPLDWNLIFKVVNQFKQDLKDHFPYKIIEVDGAEADDIIGTLTPRIASFEKVLILSSDKDFVQLQKYDNVKQYNPMLGVYVSSKNPVKDLKEKIIKGDKGDNISNILTDVNDFVSGKRQKPVSAKNLEVWLNQDPKECFDVITYERYQKNRILIDFDYIPSNLKEAIVAEYESATTNPKQKLYKYFVEKRMISLLECVDEF